MSTILTIVSVFVICILLYKIVIFSIKKFSRAYEDGYVEVATKYKHLEALEKQTQNIANSDLKLLIEKYEDIAKSVSYDNPILINTYMYLSKTYEKAGDLHSAILAIDKSISVLQRISKNNVYIVQALVSKAMLFKRHGLDDDCNKIWQSLRVEYPELKDMIDRSAKRAFLNI